MNRHTTSAITALSIGLLGVVLLAGCGGAAPGRTTDEQARAEPQGVSVTDYCEAFGRQYAGNHGLTYREDSVRTATKSDVMQFLSNLFQPADSKFTGGYACHFAASAGGDIVFDFAVDILLTNTRAFAEHTQWEKLQIVPIALVVDEARDRFGYAVFKYLDAPQGADTAGPLL